MGDTSTRLLDATEVLVAERGVDGVSLRAINAAAGANVASINYHFGTKVDLVRAVLARRSGRLVSERNERLAALVGEPDVRALAEVIVVPFLDFARSKDGASWAGFLAALRRAGEPWAGFVQEALGPHFTPIVTALARALADLDPGELWFRLDSVGAIMTGPALAPDAPGPDAVVDLATAILCVRARART